MTAETAPLDPENEEEDVTDAEVILPEGTKLVIGGIEAEVRRLKTREFLALMKVLLRGVGSGLIDVFREKNEEIMAGKLIGSLLMAIPEAENDFMLFLKRVVVPVDDTQETRAELMKLLDNPEIDEMIHVARIVIEQERDDFVRLGKEARTWWQTVGPQETTTKKKK